MFNLKRSRLGYAGLLLMVGSCSIFLPGCGSKEEEAPPPAHMQPGDKMPVPRGAMGAAPPAATAPQGSGKRSAD